MIAIRYRADLAEEHPDGNLVGVEAIQDLEQRVEELYEEGTELYDAAEAVIRAIEKAGIKNAQILSKVERWKEITGG
jgi:FtsZ-binding cell division protein ZapB